MTPARRFSSKSSPDGAIAFPPGLFELRCADVHPCGCEEVLSAMSPSGLIACVRTHGARAHGLTPVFYSRERLAAITAAAGAV